MAGLPRRSVFGALAEASASHIAQDTSSSISAAVVRAETGQSAPLVPSVTARGSGRDGGERKRAASARGDAKREAGKEEQEAARDIDKSLDKIAVLSCVYGDEQSAVFFVQKGGTPSDCVPYVPVSFAHYMISKSSSPRLDVNRSQPILCLSVRMSVAQPVRRPSPPPT